MVNQQEKRKLLDILNQIIVEGVISADLGLTTIALNAMKE